jgi:hypothetical protein
VLRDIRGLHCSDEFRLLNFEEIKINDLAGRNLNCSDHFHWCNFAPFKINDLAKNVLKAIRNLHCSGDFRKRNFAEFKIKDLAGENTSRVEMTESGFMRLVGGFNGRQVSLLRERYIKQWNVSWRTSCFGCAPRQRRPHRGVSHRSFSSANWQIFPEARGSPAFGFCET